MVLIPLQVSLILHVIPKQMSQKLEGHFKITAKYTYILITGLQPSCYTLIFTQVHTTDKTGRKINLLNQVVHEVTKLLAITSAQDNIEGLQSAFQYKG